jgi:GntR family transcriptional regulator / MocR family aminotransferase
MDARQSPKAHELLIELDRGSREPLRRQLEQKLRAGIEDGSLPDGTRLPSSRGLADQLRVSRGVVVDAYEQLTAQGFLLSHARRAPLVCGGDMPALAPPRPPSSGRLVVSPNTPDLRLFPRRLWQLATAQVMRDLPDAALDYPRDSYGPPDLRAALAGYLSRVRRVRVESGNLILTLGFLHSLDLLCRALAARGARLVAVENPSIPEQATIISRHGLQVAPIPVDDAGMVVEELFSARADAAIVTPAHQFPLGSVLSPQRRRAMVSWAREHKTLIIENDYDAEFRYDGPPVGAIQGLAPDHTAYVGTTSKTLAPAVRLGWIAAPMQIANTIAEVQLADSGGFTGLNAQILANLMLSGAYERHVQRCRRDYRRRRDALVAALTAALPQLQALGIAGGLHLAVRLPRAANAERIVEAARADGIEIRSLSYYTKAPMDAEPGLIIGYGRLPLPSVTAFADALARAIARSDE